MITEFLRARIAEDEETARAAAPQMGQREWRAITGGLVDANNCMFLGASEQVAQHIDTWDPSRVLAECQAKLQILSIHELTADVYPVSSRQTYGYACGHCGGKDTNADEPVEDVGPCETLMALAQPYAEHPEFDHAWRL